MYCNSEFCSYKDQNAKVITVSSFHSMLYILLFQLGTIIYHLFAVSYSFPFLSVKSPAPLLFFNLFNLHLCFLSYCPLSSRSFPFFHFLETDSLRPLVGACQFGVHYGYDSNSEGNYVENMDNSSGISGCSCLQALFPRELLASVFLCHQLSP